MNFFRPLRQLILTLIAVCASATSASAQQGTVDLRTWHAEGPPAAGKWTVAADGRSVTQSINGDPTFFVSPEIVTSGALDGTFRVGSSTDDDYIGFVCGYERPLAAQGDSVNRWQFILFDWKKTSQLFNGMQASAGYTLSRVDGRFSSTFADYGRFFWAHTDSPPSFDVLATRYGSAEGWKNNVDYRFRLIYEPTRIRVYVSADTTVKATDLIFDVPVDSTRLTAFPVGHFGFYNYSQNPVTYSKLTLNRAPVARPDSATTGVGTPVRLTVLTNDSDPDPGQTIRLTAVGTAAHGTTSLDGDGIRYAPAVGFVGIDRFTYTLSDDAGATATGNVTVTVGTPSGIATTTRPLPVGLRLHPAHPNPFNPATTLRLELATPAHLTVAVYNSLGQRVHVLLRGEQAPPGVRTIRFDASNLPSGVYRVHAVAVPDHGTPLVTTRQVTLLR